MHLSHEILCCDATNNQNTTTTINNNHNHKKHQQSQQKQQQQPLTTAITTAASGATMGTYVHLFLNFPCWYFWCVDVCIYLTIFVIICVFTIHDVSPLFICSRRAIVFITAALSTLQPGIYRNLWQSCWTNYGDRFTRNISDGFTRNTGGGFTRFTGGGFTTCWAATSSTRRSLILYVAVLFSVIFWAECSIGCQKLSSPKLVNRVKFLV